jgi:hypothetical protein
VWAAILIVRRRRRTRTGEEIDARTELLAEVRQWLESDKAATVGVTKP